MVVDNKATVSYIRVLKEDLAIFHIKPNEGQVPDFKPGQFVTLGLNVPNEGKIIRRAYSIASPPEQKKHFELVVRWVKKPLPGRLTTQLFDKREGDEINWVKPTGIFTINEKMPDGSPDDRRLVLIGGGTGLAPFISYSLHLKSKGTKRQIVVLHGASYVDELSYRELLTELEEQSLESGSNEWNFRYRASISRPQEWFNRSWNGHKGRVETFLRPKPGKDKSPLEELVGEKITPQNTSFYVCGWQGTVDGVLDSLVPKGFVTERNKRKDGTFDVKFESYG
ncbi:Ferredoxin--NADP reductase [Candidatus Nitrosocosmicus oleophilus]|jgi:ferredoxin/flavodoxin---NADP+ reductase|uniref:ferredoxin--NADP(+) reductase n=1 Tax=Candidatus Nitrosocosmicus oleophilus TaxID=1353260 RepID=A0A654MA07_9ARCH|nr:ferredoxin--NADP reductase [Candidatus Nitrosocosmicus oleophilus]ALI36322.1 Ferredoxin--NADP reductase [Candidatus Nitrosocosmicus oleophilus]